MDNINLQRIEGYTVQLVAEDVWAIDEFGADIIYLVKGEKSAAVIDTGSGFGNLKKVIETLTDLPYVVLNTSGSCGRQSRVRKGISERKRFQNGRYREA